MVGEDLVVFAEHDGIARVGDDQAGHDHVQRRLAGSVGPGQASACSLPAEDERFSYTVHTGSTAGTFSFPTLQTYNTGEQVGWIDVPGSSLPAPQLKTVPSGTPAPPTTPTTSPHNAPTTNAPASAGPTPNAPSGGSQTNTPGATTTIAGSPTTTATTVPGQAPVPTPDGTTDGTTPTETAPPGTDAGEVISRARPGTSAPAVAGTGSETAAGSKPISSGGAGPLIAGIVVLVALGAAGAGLILMVRGRTAGGSTPTPDE